MNDTNKSLGDLCAILFQVLLLLLTYPFWFFMSRISYDCALMLSNYLSNLIERMEKYED